MRYKIVSDSSSNLQTLEGVDYASVPLKVVTAEKEYVDDAQLDIGRMQQELRAYHLLAPSELEPLLCSDH